MKKNPSSSLALERRKQKALSRLDTDHPTCNLCSETDWRCLELHHVGQKAYDDLPVIVCRNCHRKASDLQADHPQPLPVESPDRPECIGHTLLVWRISSNF